MNRMALTTFMISLVFLNGCAAIMRGPVDDIGESTDTAVLISHLRSPSQQHRLKTVDLLSKRGERLDKSDVDEVIHMMRKGRGRWEKYLYRESHCTWYEVTSAKYYAAQVLVNVQSPYVTNEILNEAERVREREKTTTRRTDPGWICY